MHATHVPRRLLSHPRLAWGLLLLAPTGWCAAAPAAQPPSAAPPAIAVTTATWVPMQGSPAPVPVTDAGQPAVRLGCPFAGTAIERASWDLKASLDLSRVRGIRFPLQCRDTAPISGFTVYFQSGAGWYSVHFFPETTNRWETITIARSNAATEGKPAGWNRISAIRLSAWRGQDRDTEICLGDIQLDAPPPLAPVVAIVRADSLLRERPDEAESVKTYATVMSDTLRAAGVPCEILGDDDCTAERLRPFQVVVLPHNPGLPDALARTLDDYLRGGGKLFACYTVPDKLQAALGVTDGRHVKAEPAGRFSTIRLADPTLLPGAPASVRQASWNISAYQPVAGVSRVLAEWCDAQGQPTGYPALIGSSNAVVLTHVLLADDPEPKARLLFALFARLAPSVGQRAAGERLARVGATLAEGGFAAAAARVERLGAGLPRVAPALAAARKAYAGAQDLVQRQAFGAAIEQAAEADRRLVEAYCLAQRAAPGEFRAFWCHNAYGVPGLDWDTAIRRLADNGFTAIFPNMLWGGAAYYKSEVLPTAERIGDRGDQLAACVAAAHKHGVQVHVWKVNWNLGHAVPPAFVARLRGEGRLQADAAGAELAWLCPSHPANRLLEIAAMVEVARVYPVNGLHFDYIRYPDSGHCFCPGCRARFGAATGAAVTNWPGEVLADGPRRAAWLDWRREQITAVVREVSQRARAARPGIKLSAAVFRNWPTDRDSVGQDWKLWCDRGYLDFVCPMDYTPSNRQFDNMVTQQRAWSGAVPCYPGIGVSASSSRFGVERTIEQVQIARRHATGGFIIFNYGTEESEKLLPLLGLGLTAKP